MDQTLFLWINQNLTASWLDSLMLGITFLGRIPWIFIVFWILLLIKGGTKGRRVAVFLIPLLIASDMIPTYILKPLMARPRPYLAIEGVRLLVSDTASIGPYGFPSNHATNFFAIASFLSLVYRKPMLIGGLLILGLVVGYSRIYVGVHYPLDVLFGMGLGFLLGFLTYRVWVKMNNL